MKDLSKNTQSEKEYMLRYFNITNPKKGMILIDMSTINGNDDEGYTWDVFAATKNTGLPAKDGIPVLHLKRPKK